MNSKDKIVATVALLSMALLWVLPLYMLSHPVWGTLAAAVFMVSVFIVPGIVCTVNVWLEGAEKRKKAT